MSVLYAMTEDVTIQSVVGMSDRGVPTLGTAVPSKARVERQTGTTIDPETGRVLSYDARAFVPPGTTASPGSVFVHDSTYRVALVKYLDDPGRHVYKELILQEGS